MRVQPIVEKLKDEYTKKYQQWLKDNPGYVMCNYGTKEWILNTVLIDNLDLEEIIEKEKWYRDRHNNGKAHSYIPAEVLKELIELIKESNGI